MVTFDEMAPDIAAARRVIGKYLKGLAFCTLLDRQSPYANEMMTPIQWR